MLGQHISSQCRMMTIGVGNGQEEKFDVNDYDSLMYTQKAETIEPFSSHIVSVKTGKAYVGECINIMVQALQTQDGSLPQGLTIQNTYTKLRKGSKKAVMVVWNNTAYPQTLQKKTPMARAVVALPVPEPPKGEKLEEKAGKFHNSPTPVLTVRQRHGKLFDELDLSSLDSWTPGAGRCCLPAPGQIPWCVFIGSGRVRLYSFHRAYNKSDWQYPF